jgi:protein TonB
MNENNKRPFGSQGNGSTRGARQGGKHEANLQKRGVLYFQIGLILALMLVYLGLEASFRIQKPDNPPQDPGWEETFVFERDVPISPVEKRVEKTPEIKSFKFKEASDITEIEAGADVIEAPLDARAEGNMDLDSIAFSDLKKEEPPTILIDLVEEVPVFPGCEKVQKEMRLSCFREKMTKHIKRNFRYPDSARDLGIEGKVFVTFKIGVNGMVTNVEMKGPSPVLENEAARIIKKLPKMTPENKGEADTKSETR